MNYLGAVFISGTDTGCGKTVVSSALLRAVQALGYSTAGMKPVASGADMVNGTLVNDDAEMLRINSSVEISAKTRNPYTFRTPCSPHFAADLEGCQIDLAVIRDAFDGCRRAADVVVVEGVGGWRVPLGADMQTVDLVRALELPVVLVSGLRLGCISHTLLSAEAIRRDGLELLGWIANLVEPDYEFVEQTIETVSRAIEVPLLGRLDWQADLENRKIVEPLKLLDNRFWPNNIVEHH